MSTSYPSLVSCTPVSTWLKFGVVIGNYLGWQINNLIFKILFDTSADSPFTRHVAFRDNATEVDSYSS